MQQEVMPSQGTRQTMSPEKRASDVIPEMVAVIDYEQAQLREDLDRHDARYGRKFDAPAIAPIAARSGNLR
ncbi:MAG: hypothetical protein EHM55_05105 [Acidobacteria bacterium]|nr:MAG: hypothetical protein EHM55_05105 [Acidobacteriota bacterium]